MIGPFKVSLKPWALHGVKALTGTTGFKNYKLQTSSFITKEPQLPGPEVHL